MKITSIATENTGGNCMVTYIHVEGCGELTMIGIDNEYINGYSAEIEEDYEFNKCLWTTNNWLELEQTVTNETLLKAIYKAVIDYCKKYSCSLMYILPYCWDRMYRLNRMATAANTDVTQQIVKFIQSLDTLSDKLTDCEESIEYNDEYNIKIESNGTKVSLPLNADIYCRLTDCLFEIFDELN